MSPFTPCMVTPSNSPKILRVTPVSGPDLLGEAAWSPVPAPVVGLREACMSEPRELHCSPERVSCSHCALFPSYPGPQSVTQLQRAPAAAHSEVSPDCHLPTPGSEQLQVSHFILSLGVSAPCQHWG